VHVVAVRPALALTTVCQVDLHTVEVVDAPTHRAALWPLGPHDAVLAGGTWLFSEPQVHLRRLVDITALGWHPVVLHDGGVAGEPAGIGLAATCTIERLSRLSAELPALQPDWTAAPLLHQCCGALLASFKIWRTATVGGNVCLSFPAGAMISLISALDGTVTVWRADGTDYRLPVALFVTGDSTNVLTHATCCARSTCPHRHCEPPRRSASWPPPLWADPASS
jgi:CO/xanthine dehydrogenase FAD-binding subunit